MRNPHTMPKPKREMRKKVKKIGRDKWYWLPHPAHLIVASMCQFHLATKVGKHIVSTVGEWWPDRTSREIHAKIYDVKWHQKNNHLLGDCYDAAYMKRFGFMEIGSGRKYETMVFKAEKMSKEGCKACKFKIESGRDIDMRSYNNPDEAYRGHIAFCEKYSLPKRK